MDRYEDVLYVWKKNFEGCVSVVFAAGIQLHKFQSKFMLQFVILLVNSLKYVVYTFDGLRASGIPRRNGTTGKKMFIS